MKVPASSDSKGVMNHHKGILLLAVTFASSCNVCEDLDERICTDLGAEDCQLWKDNGLSYTEQAKGKPRRLIRSLLFGADSATCEASSTDAVYPQVLASLKEYMGALRQSQARQGE